MTSEPTTGNRLDRRRARTRAALVAAARSLLTFREAADVSIQEITEAADVGFGTFYNHFTTKQELFDAAVEEVMEEHGAMLDEVTVGLSDPAEVFAVSVRITARFPKTHPEIAKIIDRTGPRYLATSSGLAPRAMRDLLHARAVGRLDFDDPAVALVSTGGALLGVLHLCLTTQDPSFIDRAADDLAVNLLRMFGLSAEDARAVASRPLEQLGRGNRQPRGERPALSGD